jgi:hypothetical protein
MSRFRKVLLASVATVSLAAVTAAPAEAFWRGGHRGGGAALAAAGIGAAAGLTLGALAAGPAYGGYGYYGATPYYGYSTYGYAPSYASTYDYGYAPSYSGYYSSGYAPTYAGSYDDYEYAPGNSYSYGYAPTYRYRSAPSVAYRYQPSRQYVAGYSTGRMNYGHSRTYRQSAAVAYRGEHMSGRSARSYGNLPAYNQRTMAAGAQLSPQHGMGHAGRGISAAQSPQFTGSVNKAQRPMKAMKHDR